MDAIISVVTTVKNGERYLFDMLMSVYSQSYKCYEHIIVNDGSSDKTEEIVHNFLRDYPESNLKLINTEGIGRGYALNMAIDSALGDWIGIIDADDLWHKKKLEIQNNYIDNETVVLATESLSFSGGDIDLTTLSNEINSFNVKELKIRDFLSKNSVCHSSVLIKKDFCRYDTVRQSQFDLELWLRLIYQGKAIEKLNAVLTFHRIHKNQHFESKLGKKMALNSFKLKLEYGLKTKSYLSVIKNFCFMIYGVGLKSIFNRKMK